MPDALNKTLGCQKQRAVSRMRRRCRKKRSCASKDDVMGRNEHTHQYVPLSSGVFIVLSFPSLRAVQGPNFPYKVVSRFDASEDGGYRRNCRVRKYETIGIVNCFVPQLKKECTSQSGFGPKPAFIVFYHRTTNCQTYHESSSRLRRNDSVIDQFKARSA